MKSALFTTALGFLLIGILIGMMVWDNKPVAPTAEVQKAERDPFAHGPFLNADILDNAVSDKTTNIPSIDISDGIQSFVHCCCCPKLNPNHEYCK